MTWHVDVGIPGRRRGGADRPRRQSPDHADPARAARQQRPYAPGSRRLLAARLAGDILGSPSSAGCLLHRNPTPGRRGLARAAPARGPGGRGLPAALLAPVAAASSPPGPGPQAPRPVALPPLPAL